MDLSKLENVVKNNARDYYTTGKQELDDDVFDAVISKIREENPNSDVLSTGWGYKPNAENKIKHRYCHIGSLGKVKTLEDIKKFAGNHHFIVSAKLDGLSCVLYYEKGDLVRALTRGDGEYGIDITNKVTHIEGCITKLLDRNFTGAIRGEIFMTPNSFSKYAVEHPDAKNPRNSAAGIINSNEVTSDYKYLSLCVYTVVASEFEYLNEVNLEHLYQWLRENSFFVVPTATLSTYDSDSWYEKLCDIKDLFQEAVTIDGLVITNDIVPFNKETNTYCYNQVAFKFQDEVKITNVVAIEWTMSKHSAYIPVVVIDPIELEGTIVQRVTGYNAKWIKDMKIKSGSTVAVRKANQIIPQIVKVLS